MNIAIIAAAGQGTRVGGKPAKQFLELAGVPVIIHTLRKFEQCPAIQQVVVVLPAADVEGFLAFARTYDLRKVARVLPGGETRAESVGRGLQTLSSKSAEIVAVHDGVRPFVTLEEIERTVRAAQATGAAILAAPVIDTIKTVRNDTIERTLDRTGLRRALTPQCFKFDLLRRAFDQSPELVAHATDESSLVEALGVTVTIVEGDARNIKITRPEDIVVGEVLLKSLES